MLLRSTEAAHPSPGDPLPGFDEAIAVANLYRMWWLLVSSTALSIALAVFNLTGAKIPAFASWQIFDLGGSALFFGLFWLGGKGRLSLRVRWWLAPAYFVFWLVLMDGYYFTALPYYGETLTYALGMITPAILILLPPRIVLPLLISNHLAFCGILLGSRGFIHRRSVEQIAGLFSNGALVVMIAALASWFLYRARLANFQTEAQARRQEREARMVTAQMRAIIENMPFQVWLKDTDCRFIAVNAEFAKASNAPEREIVSKSLEEIYSPARARQYREEDEEVMRTRMRTHYEQTVEDASGTRWYEVFKHPVFDEAGAVVGVAGMARDITARKEIEVRLLDADRAKSEFLAAMSHEIRTPMNSVLGYAELLEQMIEDPAQREYVNSITESGQLLLTVINDILDLSKIEAGGMALDRRPVELVALFGRVRRMFDPLAAQKSLELRIAIDDGVPPVVLGDAVRIEQVLANLISNAIKFTESGLVAVRASFSRAGNGKEASMLQVEVIDTGIGIAPGQIDRLFKPFNQVDSSIARRFGGTGLGLTIAKSLCESMGGTIEVRSEPGIGTRFTASFIAESVQAAIPGPATEEPSRDSPADLEGLKVLVVEDNSSNRRLIAAILARWKVAATMATGGMEALDQVTRQEFDMILMDVQMPDMDGFETTRRIREWESTQASRRKSRIIAFTALAMKGDELRCLEAGMDGYLVKPLSVPALYRALVDSLKRRSVE